jgi:TP901 family phage tail tape measure protein
MAEITVDVGVRLNVIQGELANLKKLLGGIEIGTAGFSKANKAIQQMERELEKFKIQTDKSFGSTQQFNQAGKTLDKLEESLARTKIAFEGIKFGDLKLNPSQQKAFEQVEHQIEEAEARYTQFQESVKEGLIKGAGSKGLDLLGTDNLKKSFDDLDKIIDNTVTKNTKKLNDYQESLTRINALETKSKEVRAKQQAGLNENTYKDLGLEQYLAQYKGGLRYKPGVKNDNSGLLNTLADNLGLSKETRDKWLENLKNGSIKDIQKAISEIQDADLLKGLQKKNIDKIGTDKIGIEASYNELVAKLSQLQQLQEQFKAAQGDNGSLSTGMEQYNETLKECEALLARLRQEALGTFQTKASGNLAGMNSELKTFTDQLNKASVSYLKLQSQQATFNSMKMAITNFMGFNQVLNLTKRAVSDAMNHIKQLDATMNGISIVTDMTTGDLWKQVDSYSAMAQKYGVTIQGAYDVSKIYYQQGLETVDVLKLTDETLKLSKISGLDYATTTDYMTTALRGFKMEMQDASVITDVYSALASSTAVSQQELAEAMTRTASSMESVGSTFQDTSAMIATMVAVTRESANNIGSAMKSIASRYGELTKDPQKLLDSEGEAMSFNKVDAALKSVGISMQTTDHQFRDFTDVIVELSEKWDTLDSTQQRYIATQFAGNRQQSRFLALVSNGDLLKENMETAANSEDTGTLQALKALDSIESKMNQVQVAAQQFYTTIGAEGVWKGALDGITNYINTLNNFGKLFKLVIYRVIPSKAPFQRSCAPTVV